MFNSNNVPFTMPVQPANSGDGFGGDWGNGGWFWLILIVILFGGWGYGNGGWGGNQGTASVYEGYVLNNDFSVLSNQMSQGFASQERKLDGLTNGLCSLGYDNLVQTNGVNTNVMTVGNAIQTQLADCCCGIKTDIGDVKYAIGSTGADISRGIEKGFADTNYNVATLANGINTTVANGFCQTNFNAQTNTRNIIDAENANTRAILDKLCQMESNAKDDRIAELTAANADLRLAASQQAQNNYIIDKLGYHMPVAAYQVPNPFCNCNCNQGCGC